MKILFGILSAMVLAVVTIVGLALSRPKEYRVERSVLTIAPAGRVYEIMADLNRFKDWSPYLKYDPNTKITVNGASGVGQTYAWEGNDQAGSGLMTTTALIPNSQIDVKLDFYTPFASTSKGIWNVAEEGNQRKITWVMEGTYENLVMQIMSLFMDMDDLVGKDFEEGLTKLKTLAEQAG